MKQRPFKRGDYVKDDSDTYWVISATRPDRHGQQMLEVEQVITGNSYGSCESRFYRLCRKPLSFRAEARKLCQEYGMLVAGRHTAQTKRIREFGRKLCVLMAKHGDDIYTEL